MAREPPPWRSLFFLLPVPLQVIRSRDSFTPRTTGIQLLSAVVLEESISSCRKQFDIQHKRKNSRRRPSIVEEALEVPAPQQEIEVIGSNIEDPTRLPVELLLGLLLLL